MGEQDTAPDLAAVDRLEADLPDEECIHGPEFMADLRTVLALARAAICPAPAAAPLETLHAEAERMDVTAREMPVAVWAFKLGWSEAAAPREGDLRCRTCGHRKGDHAIECEGQSPCADDSDCLCSRFVPRKDAAAREAARGEGSRG